MSVLTAAAPPGEFVASDGIGEAAPPGDAPEPVLPIPGASEEDSVGGVLRPPDGGALETEDEADLPQSSVAPTSSGPVRGTNGALIFD
jgi:hypothetical protein